MAKNRSSLENPIEKQWVITGDRLFDITAFATNQDLDFYLALRAAYPDEPIIRHRMDVFAYMPLQDELESYGIPIEILVGCFDLDEEDIDKISVEFLKSIAEYKKLQKAGETHLISRSKVIPFALIDYVIELILKATEWHNVGIVSTSFNLLVRERLGGKDSPYKQAKDKKDKKHSAIVLAECLLDSGHKPTFRAIAKIMKVQPSTVLRWFPGDEFDTDLKTWLATREIRDGMLQKRLDLVGNK